MLFRYYVNIIQGGYLLYQSIDSVFHIVCNKKAGGLSPPAFTFMIGLRLL